jgi:prevent-host-death family protein
MSSTHTFRNRKGELVSMPEVPASKAKSAFGEVLERVAITGGVAITRHNVPKAVVISWEEFQSLSKARSESLDSLADEFEGLLASMQTPDSKAAWTKLFDASPEELGRAAVEAARRRPAAARRRRR